MDKYLKNNADDAVSTIERLVREVEELEKACDKYETQIDELTEQKSDIESELWDALAQIESLKN